MGPEQMLQVVMMRGEVRCQGVQQGLIHDGIGNAEVVHRLDKAPPK